MAKSSLLIGFTLALGLFSTVVAQVPLYSTETGYDLSFDRAKLNERVLSWQEHARRTGSSAPEGLQNCNPIGTYVVFREGTSFPSEADIRSLNAFQNKMRAQTINPAYQFLSQISTTRIPLASAGDLAEYGRREMQELATRIKTRFPEFFVNPDVDLSRFAFQSTNASNVIESAVAFVRGLVGLNQICETLTLDGNVTVVCAENRRLTRIVTPTSAFIPHEAVGMDPLLRPYDTKRRCLAAVNKRRTEREVRSFQRSRDTTQLRDRIARKLSRPGAQPWNITVVEVQLLAKICGYHLAMFGDNNTWCRLFDFEDLNVAEYQRELQHYWDESYGFPINSRVACPLINDTLEFFSTLTSTGAGARGAGARGGGAHATTQFMHFKFVNDDTLIRLVSLLGIAKDPRQMTAANYAQSRNRQFRSAKLAPFAGNVALNLFRCQESGGMFFSDQTYRVQVLLNEQPVNMTFCQDSFCDLTDFRRELMNQAGQCLVQRECNIAMGVGPRSALPGPGSGGVAPAPACLLIALLASIVAKIGHTGL